MRSIQGRRDRLDADVRRQAVERGRRRIAQAGHKRPLVGLACGIPYGRSPLRQVHQQILRQSRSLRFVERANRRQPVARVGRGAQRKSGAGEQIAQARKLLRRQSAVSLLRVRCGSLHARIQLEDMAEIDKRVPRNGERELGLARTRAFDRGDQQRAAIEDRRDRRQP
jgi:hypothetical protein